MILQQRVEISTFNMTPRLTVSASQCTPADMTAFLAGLPLVSRPIIAKWFRQNPKTETKSDSSPVTIADRTIETDLRVAIAQRFPADTISGEEFRNIVAEYTPLPEKTIYQSQL